jgi:hypothetical protein
MISNEQIQQAVRRCLYSSIQATADEPNTH